MPMSDDDRYWVRSQIGSATPPTDAELDDAYDRLGSALDVAVEVLEARYADAISGPAKWSVEGDFSIDNTETIKSLRAVLGGLKAQQGTVPTLTVSTLTRAEPWRPSGCR